jgi:hypothetical protein
MHSPERRISPRTQLEKIAYIQIGSNNGGIVLNASPEGLGFRSIAQIQKTGPIQFSLQENSHKIDVAGELMWTDLEHKVGGVRFSNLTSEARAQIDHWIEDSASDEWNEGSSTPFLTRAIQVAPEPAAVENTTESSRLSPPKNAASRLRFNGFSAGLVTGLSCSILLFSLLLVSYANRRELGMSLIRLGERMQGHREDSTHVSAAATVLAPTVTKPNAETVPTPTATVASAPFKPDSTSASPDHSSRPPDTHAGEILQAHENTLESKVVVQKKVPSSTIHVAQLPMTRDINVDSSARVRPADQEETISVAMAASSHDLSRIISPTQSELAGQLRPSVIGAEFEVPPDVFFELGKFKQHEAAQQEGEKLSQRGFPTSVVSRGFLWMNSYHLLVGPYRDEQQEQKIRSDLASYGYKPRPFERGSRNFALRSSVMVDQARLPVGSVTIDWESYVGDARVQFKQVDNVLATAEAKWLKRSRRYSQNEYVYGNLANGSHPLLEIHFAGLDRALVFREAR